MTVGGSGAPSDKLAAEASPNDFRRHVNSASKVSKADVGELLAPVQSGRSITDLELEFAQRPESDVYVELVRAYMDKKRFMEAMVVCKKAIRHQTGSVRPKLLLARVHETQGRMPKSLDVLRQLEAEHPDHADTQVALGRVQLGLGDEPAGLKAFQRALELEPGHAEAIKHLVDLQALPPGAPSIDPHDSGASLPVSHAEEPNHADEEGPGNPGMFSAASAHDDLVLEPQAHRDNAQRYHSEHPQPSDVTLNTSPKPLELQASADLPADVPMLDPPQPSTRIPADEFVVPQSQLSLGGPVTSPNSPFEPIGSPPDPSDADFTASEDEYRIAPQRLEGEDELERLAEELVSQRPPQGKPRSTFTLLLVLVVMSVGVLAYRINYTTRTEAIDRLVSEAAEKSTPDLYAGYKESTRLLEEVLERHNPTHGPTLARLSYIYGILLSEHLEESVRPRFLKTLERAELHASDHPETRAAKGLSLLVGTGDRAQKAGQVIEHLLPQAASGQTAAPGAVDLTLGIAELEVGDFEPAYRRLRQVSDFWRAQVRARMWVGRAAAKVGRLASAQRAYFEARKLAPRHPGAISGLALVALARGDLIASKQALDAFDELELTGSRDISPKDRARAVFAKSELLRRSGQEDAADVAYEQALRLDPNNPDFVFERGLGLLERGRVEGEKGAIRYLLEAVSAEPERWTFRVATAEALMQANKFEQAKLYLDKALERASGELRVALTKARYMRRTRDPEVEKYLTETLSGRFPEAKVEINLELGRYYRAKGSLAQAEEHLSEAIEGFGQKSPALQAEVLVSFGLVVASSNRSAEAATAYREAAQRGNLDALALLADLLQSGDRAARTEALAAAQKYLAAGTDLRRTKQVKVIAARLAR